MSPVPRMDLRESEKQEIVAYLYGVQGTDTFLKVSRLIDIMIDEFRRDNDSASIRQVMRNQGRIDGLKAFRDLMKRGLPNFEKLA